jgi:hypothetical protein
MDESLFKKHLINIKRQQDKKEEVIFYIKEKTGIEIEGKDLIISKKEITFNLSSVIRQKLFQKNLENLLKEKGYTLKK